MTPSEQAAQIASRVDRLRSHVDYCQTAEALAQISVLPDELSALTVELLKLGAQQGMTQRRMAQLLNVPESYVRGIRKEALA